MSEEQTVKQAWNVVYGSLTALVAETRETLKKTLPDPDGHYMCHWTDEQRDAYFALLTSDWNKWLKANDLSADDVDLEDVYRYHVGIGYLPPMASDEDE